MYSFSVDNLQKKTSQPIRQALLLVPCLPPLMKVLDTPVRSLAAAGGVTRCMVKAADADKIAQALASSEHHGSKLRVCLQQHWAQLHELIEHQNVEKLPQVADASMTACRRRRRCVCSTVGSRLVLRLEMALCRTLQRWFQQENIIKVEALAGNLCLEVTLTWEDTEEVLVGHITLLHKSQLPRPSFWTLTELDNSSSDNIRLFQPRVLADGLPDVTSTHLFAMKLVEDTGFKAQGGKMMGKLLKLQDSKAVVASAQPCQLEAQMWTLSGTMQLWPPDLPGPRLPPFNLRARSAMEPAQGMGSDHDSHSDDGENRDNAIHSEDEATQADDDEPVHNLADAPIGDFEDAVAELAQDCSRSTLP